LSIHIKEWLSEVDVFERIITWCGGVLQIITSSSHLSLSPCTISFLLCFVVHADQTDVGGIGFCFYAQLYFAKPWTLLLLNLLYLFCLGSQMQIGVCSIVGLLSCGRFLFTCLETYCMPIKVW
jgi:hypothetical protein